MWKVIFLPKPIFILLLTTAVISFSCKKHYYNETRIIHTGSPISGEWDFESIEVQSQSSKEYNLGSLNHKSETILNYISENNSGKLVITDSVLTAIELTYTVSSNIKTYTYTNGVLKDSSEKPYEISFYKPQSSCKYEMIGEDSVYFPIGSFTNISSSTLTTAPLPNEIIFKGDTLMFKEQIYKDTSTIKLGTDYHTTQTGTAIMRLVKHK